MIPTARSSSTATASPSAARARRGAPPVRRPACRPAASTSAGAAARTLIRASVPERGAIRLTGHTSRTIFDRDPIIHEQERLKAEDELAASGRLPVECVAVPARQTAAYVAVGDQLVAYLAQQAQAPRRGRAHPTGAAPPPRATHHRVSARGGPSGEAGLNMIVRDRDVAPQERGVGA